MTVRNSGKIDMWKPGQPLPKTKEELAVGVLYHFPTKKGLVTVIKKRNSGNMVSELFGWRTLKYQIGIDDIGKAHGTGNWEEFRDWVKFVNSA